MNTSLHLHVSENHASPGHLHLHQCNKRKLRLQICRKKMKDIFKPGLTEYK